MARATAPWPPEETEICNDDGFVYKRKRREEPPPPEDDDGDPPSSSSSEVGRRKEALLKIKERYSVEMEQWQSFSLALEQLRQVGDGSRSPPLPETEMRVEGVDFGNRIHELLEQVKTQETAIEKLADICNAIDSLCEIREEETKKQLMGLPIWMADARSLVAFLSN